jgi:hypothetical protein
MLSDVALIFDSLTRTPHLPKPRWTEVHIRHCSWTAEGLRSIMHDLNRKYETRCADTGASHMTQDPATHSAGEECSENCVDPINDHGSIRPLLEVASNHIRRIVLQKCERIRQDNDRAPSTTINRSSGVHWCSSLILDVDDLRHYENPKEIGSRKTVQQDSAKLAWSCGGFDRSSTL